MNECGYGKVEERLLEEGMNHVWMTDGCMIIDGWLDAGVDGWMGEWTYGWMEWWVGGWVRACMWIDRWMDRQIMEWWVRACGSMD